MSNCNVCGVPTANCPPSPLGPWSYWKCRECFKANRIALWEFLATLAGDSKCPDFDSRLKTLDEKYGTEKTPKYASKYLLPTLEFFIMTKEEAWNDRDNWEKYRV